MTVIQLAFAADGAIDWSAPFHVDPQRLYDTLVTAAVLYVFIIVAIRVAGVRAISQMNNFDWVVTVAIGAMIAGAIGSPRIPLMGVMAAITLLLTMQYILTTVMRRSPRIEEIVKAEPHVLVEGGKYRDAVLTAQRVTRNEVMSAVRGAGFLDVSGVDRVVLEPDASLSVIVESEGKGGDDGRGSSRAATIPESGNTVNGG